MRRIIFSLALSLLTAAAYAQTPPKFTTPPITTNDKTAQTTAGVIALEPGRNILSRGADSTGATDNSAIFTTALTNDRVVILPAGTFKLDSLVSVTLSRSITIVGQGRGATVIQCTSLSGCLDLHTTDSKYLINVRGINFQSTVNGFGTGLSITYPFNASNQISGSILSDLAFTGLDQGVNAFANGISLTNAWNTYLNSVTVSGAIGTPSRMVNGILLNCGTLAFHAIQFSVYASQNGVTMDDRTCDVPGSKIEGFDISSFEIVNVANCFNIQHASSSPGNFIHNGHCNSTAVGILANDQDQLDVHDLSLYRSLPENNWVAMLFAGGNDNIIHDNKIYTPGGAGSGNANGIVILSGVRNKIHDNKCTYWPVAGACVWLNGSPDFIEIVNNTMDTSIYFNFAVLVQTSGTNNRLSGNWPLPGQAFTTGVIGPSVGNAQHEFWAMNNSAPQDVIYFVDGQVAQLVTIVNINGNTTFIDRDNFLLKDRVPVTPTSNQTITMYYDGSGWHEIARNF